eukprot:gene12753-16995_t
MKTSIIAAALGGLMSLSALVPAEAMPLPSPTVSRSTDVQQARVVVKYGYWRGHRGYRARRPGYRMYNGFWYPPVAFGPTIVIKPRRHLAWCGPRGHRYRCWPPEESAITKSWQGLSLHPVSQSSRRLYNRRGWPFVESNNHQPENVHPRRELVGRGELKRREMGYRQGRRTYVRYPAGPITRGRADCSKNSANQSANRPHGHFHGSGRRLSAQKISRSRQRDCDWACLL